MPERDVHTLRAEALATLAAATQAANGAPDVESALRYLTAATQGVLGDKEAHLRPGGLRAGERQFVVSGIFLITPNRQHNLLVAEHGFPPEQHRLRIPLDLGHPGWVAQHQCPLVLANTDEAPDFRQRLLLDSRVVDVTRSYNPIFITISSLKPFLFNDLINEWRFVDRMEA